MPVRVLRVRVESVQVIVLFERRWRSQLEPLWQDTLHVYGASIYRIRSSNRNIVTSYTV